VLPYAGRGNGWGVRWTVYHSVVIAALAAIIAFVLLPQWLEYCSPNPNSDARHSSLITTVQSFRYKVGLFKLQHNERLPGVCPLVAGGGPFDADPATFWAQMTQFTDVDGNTSPTQSARYCYGPYLQSVWSNVLNGSTTVVSKPARGVGFVYDFAGGAGSGKISGVDSSGALVIQ
jgi:hypothetical protein